MHQESTKYLEVRLHGAIAYVPDGDTLWALMPNALVPTPSRWRPIENLLPARSPHFGFLIVNEDLIDKDKTTGEIEALFQDGEYAKKAVDTRPPAQAAILLLGEQLDFGFPTNKITIHPDVKCYMPQMSEISPKHRYASLRFHPKSKDFDRRGLSAAFQLTTGDLAVTGFFRNKRDKVDFGYVYSFFGTPKYRKRVWKRELANQLTWKVRLPADWYEVTIKSMIWKESGDPDISDYILKIPERGVLRIDIVHTETEIPALFQPDPILPRRVQRIPDPDFEVFYGLSSETSRWLCWRVPVPRDDSAGATEKPCTGGYFEGFR